MVTYHLFLYAKIRNSESAIRGLYHPWVENIRYLCGVKLFNYEMMKDVMILTGAGRPGTADEVANVAELVMSNRGAFVTGSDFLVDGGATASFFYGD